MKDELNELILNAQKALEADPDIKAPYIIITIDSETKEFIVNSNVGSPQVRLEILGQVGASIQRKLLDAENAGAKKTGPKITIKRKELH